MSNLMRTDHRRNLYTHREGVAWPHLEREVDGIVLAGPGAHIADVPGAGEKVAVLVE